MFEKINGKKTYISAGLLVLFAIIGLVLGRLPEQEAIKLIIEAMGLASIRHGIAKL